MGDAKHSAAQHAHSAPPHSTPTAVLYHHVNALAVGFSSLDNQCVEPALKLNWQH